MADWIRKDVPAVTEITLTPSSGGAFEITVGDKLVFSKLESRRFPDGDEIVRLVRASV